MDSGPALKHRPDLQGLRAVAVVLVVATHAGLPGLPGGFVGVDVFFVLSGFLITGLLLDEMRRDHSIDLARFYARRMRRLLPALAFMLVVTLALSTAVLLEHEIFGLTRSTVYAATWASNFFFVFSGQDYFDDLRTRDLFLHTWSLGVEEQFYLLWPLLLLSLIFTARKLNRDLQPFLLGSMVWIAICGYLLTVFWSHREPMQAFYLVPFRAWQFALGGCVFLASTSALPDRRMGAGVGPVAVVAGVTGCALILGAASILNAQVSYPGWLVAVPSLGAALVIWAGTLASRNPVSRMLCQHPMTWIGDRSYAWYLWHWPLLMIGQSVGVSPGTPRAGLITIIALLLAMLSHRCVETPFRSGRFSQLRPAPVLGGSVVVMCIMIVLSMRLDGWLTRPDAFERVDEFVDAQRDLSPIYRSECDSWFENAEVVACEIGPPGAKRTMVLLGDSVGIQWLGALVELFGGSWRIVVLTKSACPIVDEDYFYDHIGSIFDVCRAWRNRAVRKLAQYEPELVFLGSSAYYPFSEKQWRQGTERVLQQIHRRAGRVYIIPGTPTIPENGPTCLARQFKLLGALVRMNPECSWSRVSMTTEKVAGYLAAVAAGFSNVEVLNLTELVCPGNICSARASDGLIVFRDDKHLTETFVRKAAPMVKQYLLPELAPNLGGSPAVEGTPGHPGGGA